MKKSILRTKRLSRIRSSQKPISPSIVQTTNYHPSKTTQDFILKLKAWLKNYIAFLPWAVGGAFCYLLAYLLMVNVAPAQIANFIFPDLYLPFQLLAAGGTLLWAVFGWQNKSRGLWTMLLLNGLLFLKLQKVELTPLVVLIWMCPWVILIALSFKWDQNKI